MVAAIVTTERVPGCFLVARCDAAELLELAEAALDQVALGVEMSVEGVFAPPRRIVGNDGDGFLFSDFPAEGIGIIGRVGHDDLGGQSFDQGVACRKSPR
jgi:hypothetical protein